MKSLLSILFLLFICLAIAQPVSDLHKTAKNLMIEGDYENATLVFNKLLNNEPNNIAAQKDLAYLLYLKKEYSKSIEISKKFIDELSVEEKDYQILGLNYKAQGNYRECEKLYKSGLIKFPNSGVLYSELADLYVTDKKLNEALKNWKKGIEVDPNYPNNYYNATMYYSTTGNFFWTIIYGEIFVNIESYTVRTAEVKSAVLDAYKKILYLGINTTNDFEKEVINLLGSSTESLTAYRLSAIRTKFILHWFNNKLNDKYPFRLFDQQNFLIQEGMFDAYNQWLFGIAVDPIQYKNWVDANVVEANNFKQFQEGRVFKLITGQFYQTN